MRAFEIEAWALRILERVESRAAVEDSRVEIKSDWLEPAKAARRIAGHANAARSESVLWLVGADEKQGTVPGAAFQDLAHWFPQVKACFESEVPALQDLNVQYKGKTVAALCFDTSRFPYLVKNPRGGEIQFEVPWRDGTMIRTATRSDLILMLSPLARMPKMEILEGSLEYVTKRLGPVGPQFRFHLKVYVVPADDRPVTFAFHQCNAVLTAGVETLSDDFFVSMTTEANKAKAVEDFVRQIRRQPIQQEIIVGNATVEKTMDEIVLRGCAKILINGTAKKSTLHESPELRLTLTLTEAVSDSKIVLTGEFGNFEKTTNEKTGEELIWHFLG